MVGNCWRNRSTHVLYIAHRAHIILISKRLKSTSSSSTSSTDPFVYRQFHRIHEPELTLFSGKLPVNTTSSKRKATIIIWKSFGWHFGFPCPIIIKIYILSRQQQSKILSESHQRINQNGSYNQPSGQIIIFQQPRFPWNKRFPLNKPPFGVRSCEVAIIWPEPSTEFLGVLVTTAHAGIFLLTTIPSSRQWAKHKSLEPSLVAKWSIFCWLQQKHGQKMVKKQRKTIDSHPEFYFSCWLMSEIYRIFFANHLRVVGFSILPKITGLYTSPSRCWIQPIQEFCRVWDTTLAHTGEPQKTPSDTFHNTGWLIRMLMDQNKPYNITE